MFPHILQKWVVSNRKFFSHSSSGISSWEWLAHKALNSGLPHTCSIGKSSKEEFEALRSRAAVLSLFDGRDGSRRFPSFLYTGPGCDSDGGPGLPDGAGSLGSSKCR